MSALTTWRTDDPCPVCGTGLYLTDDPAGNPVAQDCACAAGPPAGRPAGRLPGDPRLPCRSVNSTCNIEAALSKAVRPKTNGIFAGPR
jgi:hypothetical protein